MNLKCPHCRKNIHLKQKYPYHAGFSDVGFLYCNMCPTLLLFRAYDLEFEKLVGETKVPWSLILTEKKKVEDNLKPCPCGGHFRFDAYPRCPYCNQNVQSLLPDNIHFIEFGKVIDADKDESIWISIGKNSDGRNKPSK
ncbi:MAG: hypothetical protein HY877_07725 [Deltaproteobacteria bacterium]|nr:hypothetical protein [Deltaproteobacteria bacterium]